MCEEDFDILENFLEANADDTPFGFGKYANKTPREILYNDPGYIVWAKENVKRFECSKEIYKQAVEDSFSHTIAEELCFFDCEDDIFSIY